MGEGAAGWLKNAGYVVASERLADRARALGIREQPVVATGADDESLLEALIRWREVQENAGH
jgi:uroporphyrinogen-III synthase